MPDQTEARLLSAEIQINRVTSLLKKYHTILFSVSLGGLIIPSKALAGDIRQLGAHNSTLPQLQWKMTKSFQKQFKQELTKN